MFQSNNKKRLKQKTRISLRMIFSLVFGLISLAIVVIIMLFYFADEEPVQAKDQMVFMYAEAFQKDQQSFKGNKNQVLIGVVIETVGKENPLKLSGITFKVKSSPVPPSDIVQNIRLWSTGTSKNYEALKPQGSTLIDVTEHEMRFNTNMILSPGLNYIWLTADINENAPSNSTLDAECLNLKIGAIEFLPLISSPEGKMTIAFYDPLFSTGSFAFSNIKGWSQTRSSISSPMLDSRSSHVYYIQSGHQVTIDTPTDADIIIVEKGGKLRIENNLVSDQVIIEDGGHATFNANSTASGIRKFLLEGKSRYSHYSITRFPFKTWVVSDQSLIELNKGTPHDCFSPDNGWSNLILKNTVDDNSIIDGSMKHIRGNLSIESSQNKMKWKNHTSKIEIDGNLELRNVELSFSDRDQHHIMIKGNLVLNDAALKQSIGNAKSTIDLYGNMILHNSEFIGQSNSQIMFAGNKRHIIKHQGSNISFGNGILSEGAALTFMNEGIINVIQSFIVSSSSELDFGEVVFKGEGSFILKPEATVKITHSEGLYSSENKGNVQMAKRLYSDRANYIYSGASNPQFTGKFNTVANECTINTLGINKKSAESWLVLEQDFTIDNLRKSSGTLIKNVFEIKRSSTLVNR